MPNAPRTTQLYRLSLAVTGSSKKVSLSEGESGLTNARKSTPPRYKPARVCLAACLTEAARGTEVLYEFILLSGDHVLPSSNILSNNADLAQQQPAG